MRRLAAITCAALFLFAGAADAGHSTDRRHTVPGYGISLSLPSSWKGLTPQQARKLLNGAESVAKDNPELAGAIAQLLQPKSPMKFFAFDPILFQRFATNVNILVNPLAPGIHIDDYEREIVSALRSLPISNLQSAKVRLPGGEAVRFTYNLKLKQSAAVAATQYAFLRPTSEVVVTYTTLPQTVRIYRPIFSASARSIRFAR